MDIIEPVTLGDVAFTRPSPKWVFDRTGTLVQVPAGSFAVTYDPIDLTKAPHALIEPAATNLIKSSETLTTGWSGSASVTPSGETFAGIAYQYVTKTTSGTSEFKQHALGTFSAGQKLVATLLIRAGTSSSVSVGLYDPTAGVFWGANADARVAISGPGVATQAAGSLFHITDLSASADTFITVERTYQLDVASASLMIYPGTSNSITIGASVLVTRVQVEKDLATSYIPTVGTTASRSADVVASGAGLVYSNVPITEPDYSSTTTYAKDAVVHDPATHNTYVSIIAGNVGKALTDTSAWAPNGVTNRWAMLDQYNNTQTTSAEEIILVVSPQAISRGFYVGNVDASDVRVAMTDLYKGLVYQETQSLRVPNSGSSFFNWCFGRKRNRTWAVSLKLRPYANALVTITIRKPGGTAKCGMCAVGPTMDLGRTLMTLGAEIKDFSDTSFNFDGTSKTTIRNWAKRITADVIVDASRVDDVYEFMASYRQRPLVWVGSPNYGLAIAFGRYSGIKPVVKGANRWDMSMQIEGTV